MTVALFECSLRVYHSSALFTVLTMAAGDIIDSEAQLRKHVLLAYSDIAAAGRSVNDYTETNISKHNYVHLFVTFFEAVLSLFIPVNSPAAIISGPS